MGTVQALEAWKEGGSTRPHKAQSMSTSFFFGAEGACGMRSCKKES